MLGHRDRTALLRRTSRSLLVAWLHIPGTLESHAKVVVDEGTDDYAPPPCVVESQCPAPDEAGRRREPGPSARSTDSRKREVSWRGGRVALCPPGPWNWQRMGGTSVLVRTRKGAFVLTSGEGCREWKVDGPRRPLSGDRATFRLFYLGAVIRVGWRRRIRGTGWAIPASSGGSAGWRTLSWSSQDSWPPFSSTSPCKSRNAASEPAESAVMRSSPCRASRPLGRIRSHSRSGRRTTSLAPGSC